MADEPRYWGGDPATAGLYRVYGAARRKNESRDRDMEFYARWGYFPQQAGAARQAQDQAENEWQQIVSELEGRMQSMRENPQARQLEDYYRGVVSGKDVPFDEQTTASLASRVSDPIARGGRDEVERLRAAFAQRGLGRSGTLGSIESRYRTDAALNAGRAASDVRIGATQANYAARAAGAEGQSRYNVGRESGLNTLATTLAGLRAQRSYTPGLFTNLPGQSRRETPSRGAYTYSPPPELDRRRTGTAAPTYKWGA